MKKWIIWICFLIFTAAIIIACGSRKSKQNIKEQQKIGKDAERKEIFQADYQKFDVDVDYTDNFYYYNEQVYMIGSIYSKEKKREIYWLIHCNTDGTYLQKSKISLKKGERILGGFCVGEDGIQRFITWIPNEKGENKFFIRTFDQDGQDKERYKIACKEQSEFRYPMITKENNIYLIQGGMIYCFNEKGKEIGRIEYDNFSIEIKHLLQTGNGIVYAYCSSWEDASISFYKVDLEEGILSEKTALQGLDIHESGIDDMRSGEESGAYLSYKGNLYHIDLSNGESTKIFHWIDSGVNSSYIRDYISIGKDSFFIVADSFIGSQRQKEVITVKKEWISKDKERKVLTIASTATGADLDEKIIEFNRTNKEYKLEVRHYESTENQRGIDRMNFDMISGNIPDIIDMNNIPKDIYIRKGLLTNLYPLMEKDKEIHKEDFLEPIIKAAEVDGKLYSIGRSFGISEFYLSGKNYFREEKGICIDKIQKLYEAVPKSGLFQWGVTKQSFVSSMIYSMEDFVDWKSGEARFDSDYFLKILEFSNYFPDDSEREQYYKKYDDNNMKKMVKKGNLMLYEASLNNWADLSVFIQMFKPAGGLTFITCPTIDGRSNAIKMNFFDSFAITEQCNDKEGAWEFLKLFLGYEYQMRDYSAGFTRGFPIRKDAFEKMAEYTMVEDMYLEEDGREIEPIGYDPYTTSEIYNIVFHRNPLKIEEIDLLRDLIERIDGECRYDLAKETIFHMVQEEIMAYFAGDKTAKETAEIVQNRVKLYINETL